MYTGIKILDCVENGKACTYVYLPCRHERIQTREKPSGYTQCVKIFAYNSLRQRHKEH